MIEIGKQALFEKGLPHLPPTPVQRIDLEWLPTAPRVQLLSRDAFVSEVAGKLDRVNEMLASLSRDVELVKGDLAELRDLTDSTQRFTSFQEKELKIKASRIEEVQRRVGELKVRLAAFECGGDGAYRAYGSFEAVSRKLTELSALERQFKDVERKLRLSAALFCASLAVWVAVVFAF